MSILSKIIDSVTIRVGSAEMHEVVAPVHLSDIILPLNYLAQLNKGYWIHDDNLTPLKEGSFIFRPAGFAINSKHKKAAEYHVVHKEFFSSDDELTKYFKSVNPLADTSGIKELFSFVAFDALIYDSIPFFKVLDVGGFVLPYDDDLSALIRNMCIEFSLDKIGRTRLLKNFGEEIVIQICRYMASQPQFEKKMEKINYLTDKRLLKIIQYISENIGGDLSNKRLSVIAFLSEDYIGQFFKSLTNSNIQEYVENQRLERAREMLNTTSDNIQQISQAVGFKDAAYFSRRFKLKFNINANVLRKSDGDII